MLRWRGFSAPATNGNVARSIASRAWATVAGGPAGASASPDEHAPNPKNKATTAPQARIVRTCKSALLGTDEEDFTTETQRSPRKRKRGEANHDEEEEKSSPIEPQRRKERKGRRGGVGAWRCKRLRTSAASSSRQRLPHSLLPHAPTDFRSE